MPDVLACRFTAHYSASRSAGEPASPVLSDLIVRRPGYRCELNLPGRGVCWRQVCRSPGEGHGHRPRAALPNALDGPALYNVLYPCLPVVAGGTVVIFAARFLTGSLRSQPLGGALILGSVTFQALLACEFVTPDWSRIPAVGRFCVVLEFVLLATVVMLAIIYVRRPSPGGRGEPVSPDLGQRPADIRSAD
jgi:hypothetical protein